MVVKTVGKRCFSVYFLDKLCTCENAYYASADSCVKVRVNYYIKNTRNGYRKLCHRPKTKKTMIDSVMGKVLSSEQ